MKSGTAYVTPGLCRSRRISAATLTPRGVRTSEVELAVADRPAVLARASRAWSGVIDSGCS